MGRVGLASTSLSCKAWLRSNNTWKEVMRKVVMSRIPPACSPLQYPSDVKITLPKRNQFASNARSLMNMCWRHGQYKQSKHFEQTKHSMTRIQATPMVTTWYWRGMSGFRTMLSRTTSLELFFLFSKQTIRVIALHVIVPQQSSPLCAARRCCTVSSTKTKQEVCWKHLKTHRPYETIT